MNEQERKMGEGPKLNCHVGCRCGNLFSKTGMETSQLCKKVRADLVYQNQGLSRPLKG
jgi:hypothetical protein